MEKEQLEKGKKLKQEIDELKGFIQYIRDCKSGIFTIRKPKLLFKYKTWFGIEKSFELNERLTFRMLLEVENELEDLQKQFDKL